MLTPEAVWREVAGPEQVASVELIKMSNHTPVYRLRRAGGRAGIIAKRCRAPGALLERLLYSSVLNHTLLRFPKLFGFVADPDSEDAHQYYWLLLDDLGPQRHNPTDADERRRLAVVLGTLAGITVSLPPEIRAAIRVRDLPYYRPFLEQALEGLPKAFAGRQCSAQTQKIVHSAQANLSLVARSWGQMEDLADGAPTVLAHNDCLPKNIHVVEEPGHPIVPIDWGSAGFGLPGIDLGVSTISFDQPLEITPDVETYVTAVRPVWPNISADQVTRLTFYGRILWITKVLAQSLPVFQERSKAKAESYLKLYASVLDRSVAGIGWQRSFPPIRQADTPGEFETSAKES